MTFHELGPQLGADGWAEANVWGNVPMFFRFLDADNGDYLRGLLLVFEAELDDVRKLIRDMPLHRDPWDVRVDEVYEDVEIASSEVIEDPRWGRVIKFTLTAGVVAEEVSVNWIARYQDRTLKVLSINTRDDPNVFLLTSGTDPTVPAPVTIRFLAPPLIGYLAKDFDINDDENESEDVRRATLAHITAFLGWKAAERSYRVRGEVAGFDVVSQGLFGIATRFAAFLPSDHTYELPSGSGRYYTDLEPRSLRYDDIAADVIDAVDIPWIYAGTLGDSPAKVFADNVGTYIVTSVTPLTPTELEALTLPFGYRVVGTMSAADKGQFGVTAGSGVFSIVEDATSDESIIEFDESYADPVWTLVVAVSAAPPLGNYHIKYFPDVVDSCEWCRAHMLRFEITPTTETLAHYSDPYLMLAAIDRLIVKLKRLVPIHVRIAEFVLATRILVTVGGKTVEITIHEEQAMFAPHSGLFDAIPADEIPADTVGPEVSIGIVIT